MGLQISLAPPTANERFNTPTHKMTESATGFGIKTGITLARTIVLIPSDVGVDGILLVKLFGKGSGQPIASLELDNIKGRLIDVLVELTPVADGADGDNGTDADTIKWNVSEALMGGALDSSPGPDMTGRIEVMLQGNSGNMGQFTHTFSTIGGPGGGVAYTALASGNGRVKYRVFHWVETVA